MKKRTLTLAFCLMLVFSLMIPMAYAAGPDVTTPGDDPVDPDPYAYIDSVYTSLSINSAGTSYSYCYVYVWDTTKTCEITMMLQRQTSNTTWSTVTSWVNSGVEDVWLYEPYNVTVTGNYRVKTIIDIYDSDDLLCESEPVYSNVVHYNAPTP